jgi:hypothetical protein
MSETIIVPTGEVWHFFAKYLNIYLFQKIGFGSFKLKISTFSNS